MSDSSDSDDLGLDSDDDENIETESLNKIGSSLRDDLISGLDPNPAMNVLRQDTRSLKWPA